LDRSASFELPQIGRAYGPPRKFQGTFPYLYHNEGNGVFRDMSADAGIQIKDPRPGCRWQIARVAPVDVDADGWMICRR